MHRNGVLVQASTIDPSTWVGDTPFLSLNFEPSMDVAEWRVDNFVIENLAAIGGGRPLNLGLSLGL